MKAARDSVAAVGLVLAACADFPAWRDQVLRDVMAGRFQVSHDVGVGAQPSQCFDLYDAGGRRVGLRQD